MKFCNIVTINGVACKSDIKEILGVAIARKVVCNLVKFLIITLVCKYECDNMTENDSKITCVG